MEHASFNHLCFTHSTPTSHQERLCRALHKDFLKDQSHERRIKNYVRFTKTLRKNKFCQIPLPAFLYFSFFLSLFHSKISPSILLLNPLQLNPLPPSNFLSFRLERFYSEVHPFTKELCISKKIIKNKGTGNQLWFWRSVTPCFLAVSSPYSCI